MLKSPAPDVSLWGEWGSAGLYFLGGLRVGHYLVQFVREVRHGIVNISGFKRRDNGLFDEAAAGHIGKNPFQPLTGVYAHQVPVHVE